MQEVTARHSQPSGWTLSLCPSAWGRSAWCQHHSGSLKPWRPEGRGSGGHPALTRTRGREVWGSETREPPNLQHATILNSAAASACRQASRRVCARAQGRGHAGACVKDARSEGLLCSRGYHHLGWENAGRCPEPLSFFLNFIKQEMSRCVNKIHLSWKAARPLIRPGPDPAGSGAVLLPLPKALDVAVPGRRYHHQPLGRVLEHQHAQLPRVGQQQLKVHLRQELVIQDAWGWVGQAGGEGMQRPRPLPAASGQRQQTRVLRTNSCHPDVRKDNGIPQEKPCKPTQGDD